MMARRGYVPPPKNREAVKERAAAIDAQERQRAADAGEEIPKLIEVDRRPLAQRIGLGPGLNLDAELARRKEAALAKPNSPEFIRILMARCGLDEDIARLYALFMRCVEPPKMRRTPIAVVEPGETRDRMEVAIETGGPGAPPAGFAHFYPGNVDTWLVLGVTPPGLVPTVSPTFSPLSQPPAALTAQQRLDAARVMERTLDQLEARDCLRWVQRNSWAWLHV